MQSFHPIVKEIYSDVHDWLTQLDDVPHFRQNNAWEEVKKQLTNPTFESAVLQYYVLFPAHSAKVICALEDVIGVDRIAQWLRFHRQVTIIDVGCGAGAASIAFANVMLTMHDNGHLQDEISVHFVGIDPNEYAIPIYYQQMMQLQSKVKQYGIQVTHTQIAEGDLQAVSQLREELARLRNSLQVPFLGHAFLFQANVVSPFSTRFHEAQSRRQRMLNLGMPADALGNVQDVFGREEAIAFKQILENSFIDNLHVITVGTKGYEQRVAELAQAIDSEFQDNNHVVSRFDGGKRTVTYEIPDRCYWKEIKRNNSWELSFSVEISSVSNVALADDDWREVKSTENLLVAWARARNHLLSQGLVDEVEIRLFEAKLEVNINRLQEQLVAYAQDVVRTDERLHFKFPKGDHSLRPLGLSRIEEEILATAVIQKLGQRISNLASRSYAYKFARSYGSRATEYLYENWFDAHTRYLNDVQVAAQNCPDGVVIQTDIQSFYTRIIRDSLLQLSTKQLSQSERVQWLLRALFSRDISDHAVGRGIVQGNLASGFFANLYLVDLDARFGINNEWQAKFYRYVDDMVIVIPNPEDVDEIIAALDEELEKLELNRNAAKTVRFDDVSEFVRAIEKDQTLSELQARYQTLVSCLWIMDDEHRQAFRRAYNQSQAEWWYRIEVYSAVLRSIGIFVDVPVLSRRIYKYLFNEKSCKAEFTWQYPFKAPALPDGVNDDQIGQWKIAFEKDNVLWIEERRNLCDSLFALLLQSCEGLRNAASVGDALSEKRFTSTFRFCINRLLEIQFRYDGVIDVAAEVLRESPWVIHQPSKLADALAKNGRVDQIEALLSYYADETDETKEYMKSILIRSIRYLTNVSKELWQLVVANAVSASNVVSLMATETWLKLVQNQPELVEQNHLLPIKDVLAKDEKPITRLMKNYLLILGENGLDVVAGYEEDHDFQLRDARELIQTGHVDSLFGYHEPQIVTLQYYSGYRSDHDEYYHPSSP